MATVLIKLDKNQPTQGKRSDNPLVGKRVVVVDDNPRQRAQLRAVYESLGLICVGEASNGLECLQVVARTTPHLVSLDVLMPVMHGVEALGYLREEGFEGAIVFVTEISQSDSLSELKYRGFHPDAVFSKSDSREVFSSVLRDVFVFGDQRVTDDPTSLDPTGT